MEEALICQPTMRNSLQLLYNYPQQGYCQEMRLDNVETFLMNVVLIYEAFEAELSFSHV